MIRQPENYVIIVSVYTLGAAAVRLCPPLSRAAVFVHRTITYIRWTSLYNRPVGPGNIYQVSPRGITDLCPFARSHPPVTVTFALEASPHAACKRWVSTRNKNNKNKIKNGLTADVSEPFLFKY